MLPKVLQLQDNGAQYVFFNAFSNFALSFCGIEMSNPLSWTNVMS